MGDRGRGDEETGKPAVGTNAAGSSQDFGISWWRLSNHSTLGASDTKETPRSVLRPISEFGFAGAEVSVKEPSIVQPI